MFSYLFQYHFAKNNLEYEFIFQGIGLILLSISTTLLADGIINNDYRKKIKEYLYEIIDDTKIMREFLDYNKREQILKTTLEATLGSDVAYAIDNIIINNYLNKNIKLYRENYYCNLNLKEFS